MEALEALGILGLSITAPLKLSLPQALGLEGPLNTLWRRAPGQPWQGANTDAEALGQSLSKLDPGPVLLLGGGGVGRTSREVLEAAGRPVLQVSRQAPLHPAAVAAFAPVGVVQATSLGMAPEDPAAFPGAAGRPPSPAPAGPWSGSTRRTPPSRPGPARPGWIWCRVPPFSTPRPKPRAAGSSMTVLEQADSRQLIRQLIACLPMDLLLVEDKDSFRRLLIQALEGSAWSVRAVADPQEALRALEAAPSQVLVTDLRLPGMSGLELIRRARQLHPTLRVVLMSAFGEPRDIVEAMRLGAEDFLPKPFDLDVFLALLDRLRALVGAPPPDPAEPWIAHSAPMQALDQALRRAAGTDAAGAVPGRTGGRKGPLLPGASTPCGILARPT